MLKKWKASNDIIKNTQQCVDAINNIKQDRLDEWEMYQTGEDLLIKANHIAKLYGFEQNESDLISKYEHLNIKDKKEMAINGGDLIKSGVVKPGPEMGKILFKLEKALVCNEIDNDKESLIEAAKNF